MAHGSGARLSIVILSNPFHLDRTIPAVLRSYLQPNEWTSFCDDVDQDLLTLSRAIRPIEQILYGLHGLAMASFATTFVCFFMTFVGALIRPEFYVISFFSTFVIFFFTFIFTSCAMLRVRSVSAKATQRLEIVCQTWSNKLSSISFHVRSDMFYRYGEKYTNADYYIEAFVDGYAPPRRTSKTTSTSLVTNATLVTPTDRLLELDRMRPHLTDNEYQSKRAEIFSMV